MEDPECCVFGSLFSCPMNSNINNKGIKAQMKRISRNVSVKTFKGINVAVRDSVITDMSSFPRYIEIPSGRYDDYRLALERHLCYERLGSSKFTSDSMTFYEKGLTHDAINVNDLLRRHSSPHLTDYCGGNVESTDDVIIEKVKDIQVSVLNEPRLHFRIHLKPYICNVYKLKTEKGMLCYVMLCSVMFCYVMLCYVMLCYVMLCYVMLCYVMLCYVMLCYVMFCYALLCSVMLCYVMLFSVMFCYVMLCYVIFCYVMFCYVMLRYVMLCYVIFCYVMFCYVMLCYVMLCYVMLCYVMLCYVMLCYAMLLC